MNRLQLNVSNFFNENLSIGVSSKANCLSYDFSFLVLLVCGFIVRQGTWIHQLWPEGSTQINAITPKFGPSVWIHFRYNWAWILVNFVLIMFTYWKNMEKKRGDFNLFTNVEEYMQGALGFHMFLIVVFENKVHRLLIYFLTTFCYFLCCL